MSLQRNSLNLTNTVSIEANEIRLIDQNNISRDIYNIFIDEQNIKTPIENINEITGKSYYEFNNNDINNSNVVSVDGLIKYGNNFMKNTDKNSRNIILEDNSFTFIKKIQSNNKKVCCLSICNDDIFIFKRTYKTNKINNFINNEDHNYVYKKINKRQNIYNSFDTNNSFTNIKNFRKSNIHNTYTSNDNFTSIKNNNVKNNYNNLTQENNFNYQKQISNNNYTSKKTPNYILQENYFYINKNYSNIIKELTDRIILLES